MFRCPVCHQQESSRSANAPDQNPTRKVPFAFGSQQEAFTSAAHASGYFEPKRQKYSSSPYFTPPTSPPNDNTNSERTAKNPRRAHGFSQTKRSGGAFPFSIPPIRTPGTVPISTLNEVQEAMLNLAVENERLNTMLILQTKEKEELVSRHEEQCFRMVDDFVREKEEIWMSHNDSKKKENKSRKKSEPVQSCATPALKLECIEGPHSGETFILTGTLFVGKKPVHKVANSSYKDTSSVVNLWKDPLISTTHAKLILKKSGSVKNPVLMTKVYDMKSANGTKLNNKILPKGSNRQAFVKDRIQFGNSVLLISKMK